MSAAAPLEGRVVLLLRPEGRADELARRLRALGASVEHAPVLAFEPPHDDGPARAAIAGLDRYDLVVFTSASGVRAFITRAGAVRTAAVGPGTAAALIEAGIAPSLVAAGGVEQLVLELGRLEPPARSILVVRPEGGGSGSFDALRGGGVRVDEVAFYRTVAAKDAAAAAAQLASGGVDAVVFTSPSALRCLVDSGTSAGVDCARALGAVRRVAIGPTTAAALSAAGWSAHAIAEAPTPESMCAAVLAALRSGPRVC